MGERFSKADLFGFLKGQRLGVMASVSARGTSQSALVGIAVTDSLEVVFDTLDTTRKCVNLRKNPNVSLVIGWEADEVSVQYEGIADEPKGGELHRLKERYFAVYPDGVERQHWKGLTYFRAKPLWARYSNYKAQPEPIIIEFDLARLESDA